MKECWDIRVILMIILLFKVTLKQKLSSTERDMHMVLNKEYIQDHICMIELKSVGMKTGTKISDNIIA